MNESSPDSYSELFARPEVPRESPQQWRQTKDSVEKASEQLVEKLMPDWENERREFEMFREWQKWREREKGKEPETGYGTPRAKK